MAKTVAVLPRDDGQDFQESWMVHVSGKMKSNHTTKQAATNAAREYANEGDTLEIRRTDGTIQSKSTVRSSGDDEPEKGGLMPSSPNKYGEATRKIGVEDFLK